MRVYVIGKYSNQIEVGNTIAKLKAAGHVITEDWTKGENPEPLSGGERLEVLRRAAEADKKGVLESEAIIVLHDNQLCGGLVEFGLAASDSRRILLVVEPPNPTARRQPIFYWLPEVRFFSSTDEAIQFLNECEKKGWY